MQRVQTRVRCCTSEAEVWLGDRQGQKPQAQCLAKLGDEAILMGGIIGMAVPASPLPSSGVSYADEGNG